MEIEDIKNTIKESYSINDSCVKIYGYCNGRTIDKIKYIISEYDIDINHFDKGHKNRKYEIITKECPSCGNLFNLSMFGKGIEGGQILR